MIKLTNDHAIGQDLRDACCEALIEEARRDERIVAVNCDLRSSMGLKPFAKEFPDRELNVGIMECNGCGMAGGMSAAGLIPFFATFAAFATRRVYDQIFLSCAYSKLNVKILGGDAGITATSNGGTHMPFEDMGILRVMPGVTVMEPSDAVMMKSLIHEMANTYGVQYLRFNRKGNHSLYEPGSSFTIGKGVVLRDGTDVTLIANGLMVYEALLAAQTLANEGVSARVVDMFTIKPLDEELVVDSAARTGAIVTAENHQVIGGLGSAVAEVLAEKRPTVLERVGIHDEFGEVGTQAYLAERFKLNAAEIVRAARQALARKAQA
ncbi:MAG: transketolase family protein [Oscillospiraceae bacterium]|nr:transketolase family protein [Oscillospiraceae bacterium]